jgi:CheY-like chemotaxis protein
VKNSEIEAAQVALQERAEQLALSSQYKSEFLANMSHELRTPLNSLLILARLLAEDPDGHLAPKQVEYARTIHAAGTDLLTLISDILDLSKVEAGKMELHPVVVPVRAVIGDLAQTFEPTADQKGLDFEIVINPDAPDELRTDEQRLQQVVRNLLSNALKFTERGQVRLIVGRPEQDVEFTNPHLISARDDVVSFAVVDTGVGVPREKLDLIFEAFQQADGTTSRRFGGTGLGLSISREITSLLGGELHVESEVGVGSTFTLYLPVRREFGADSSSTAAAAAAAEERREERAQIRAQQDAARVKRAKRTVLVVDPDDQRIHDIVTLIGDANTNVVGARGAAEALAVLAERTVDCAVIDVDASDVVDVLEGDLASLPVIMVVRDSVTDEVNALLERIAEARPVRPVSSPRELYDATAVFVHRRPLYAVAGSRTATKMPAPNPALEGRRILLVDDDPRNLFAVSSVLEAQRMEVVFAENGMDGIALLQNDPTIELVLMDIMMPGMDGYATIQVIREEPRFADLPIVALTAKAMVGDREKTLAAGASDYITKPVDIDDLLRVVSDWLTR